MRLQARMKRIWVAAIVTGAGLAAMQAMQSPVHAALSAAPARALAAARNAQQATSALPSKPESADYAEHCAICHGDQREGILPGFPPLAGIRHQMTDEQITALIRNGKGRMPGFPGIADTELSG
jgi:cytochrome c553